MKYFINLDNDSKIIDTIKAHHMGELGDRFQSDRKLKAVYDACFKVYAESEKIRKSMETEELSPWFPLYRGLGSEEEDFEFSTREEALKLYEEHIGEKVFCWAHDC